MPAGEVTFGGLDVPVAEAVEVLRDASGVDLRAGRFWSTVAVDISWLDRPIEAAMADVARWGEGEWEETSEGWELRPLQESIRVLHPGMSEPAAAADLAAMVSGVQGASVVAGEVVLSGASETDVARLQEVLHRARKAYTVEVLVVEVDARWLRNSGIEPSLQGAVKLELGTEGGEAEGVVGLGLVGQWIEEAGSGAVVLEGNVHVLDGETARVRRGESTPVPRRTVSPQGTVSVVGVEVVQTGLLIEVQARDLGEKVLLEVKPEVSNVTGHIHDWPIVSESVVESSVIMERGEVVCLVGLENVRESQAERGMPGVGLKGRQSAAQRSSLVVFVRVDWRS